MRTTLRSALLALGGLALGLPATCIAEEVSILPLGQVSYSDRFSAEELSLSADGRILAAVSRSSGIGARVWEVEALTLLPRQPELPSRAWSLQVDPDGVRGAYLVDLNAYDVGVQDAGGAGAYIMPTLSSSRTTAMAGAESLTTLRWSEDGSALIGTSEEGIWRWDGDGESPPLLVWEGPGAQAAVVPEAGDALVLVNADNDVLHIGPEGEQRRPTTLDTSDVWTMDAGGRVLAQVRGQSLSLVDIAGGVALGTPLALGSEAVSLALADDLGVLAVGHRGGSISLYRLGGISTSDWQQEPTPEQSASPPPEADHEGSAAATEPPPEPPRLEGPEARLSLPRLDGALLVRALPVPEFAGDPRTPASVAEAIVNLGDTKLRRCFHRSLARTESPVGRLSFRLPVNFSGAGQRPIERTLDTFGSEDLVSCLEGLMREGIFGTGTGHMQLDYELEVVLVEE